MKYIYTLLVLIFIYVIGNDIYKQYSKSGAMSHRIACHKTYKTFERTYDKALLKKAQKQVLSGEYNLTSCIKEAKYMQTKMFKYVELENVNQMVRDEMAKKEVPHSKSEGVLHIDYYIYENDKADPGKKTKKSKLYAGFLRFILAYNGKDFYSVQTDFMSLEGRDIPQSVECAIESFITAS